MENGPSEVGLSGKRKRLRHRKRRGQSTSNHSQKTHKNDEFKDANLSTFEPLDDCEANGESVAARTKRRKPSSFVEKVFVFIPLLSLFVKGAGFVCVPWITLILGLSADESKVIRRSF